MAGGLDSPLSGRVTSDFGGAGRFKSKIIFGVALVAIIPFTLSTFAASVTAVGNPRTNSAAKLGPDNAPHF